MLKLIFSLFVILIMVYKPIIGKSYSFPIRVTANPTTGQFYINVTPSENHSEQYTVFFIPTGNKWQARPFFRHWWKKNPHNQSLSSNFRFQECPPFTNKADIIHPGNIEINTLILLSEEDRKAGKYYGDGTQPQECAITLLDYPISDIYSTFKNHKDGFTKFIYFYAISGCILMAKDLWKYAESNSLDKLN